MKYTDQCFESIDNKFVYLFMPRNGSQSFRQCGLFGSPAPRPVKYTDGIRSHNGGLEFVYDYSPDITFAYSYAGSSNTQVYKVENYSQNLILLFTWTIEYDADSTLCPGIGYSQAEYLMKRE